MTIPASLGRALLMVAALAVGGAQAAADDTLKLAVGQRGSWDTGVSELGQRAGIFKKHGLVLELLYTEGGGETQQAVISGSVDIGIGLGTMGVFGAFAKGAPVRVISSEITGSTEFWYVPAASPVKSLADAEGKSIAYSTNGSSSNAAVLALLKQNGVKGKPVAAGGAPATFTQVMSGQIDIGWTTPPFALDALDQGKIRLVARGNDAPALRNQTVRVNIVNAAVLASRKEVVARFMQAYRETVRWMYQDPQAIKLFAEFAGMPEAIARRVPGEFTAAEQMAPDRILGVDAVMADAVAFKYLPAPLSQEQLDTLIQIPPP